MLHSLRAAFLGLFPVEAALMPPLKRWEWERVVDTQVPADLKRAERWVTGESGPIRVMLAFPDERGHAAGIATKLACFASEGRVDAVSKTWGAHPRESWVTFMFEVPRG